jgi:hypothetical protein
MLSAKHKLSILFIGRCGHLSYTFVEPPTFSTSPEVDLKGITLIVFDAEALYGYIRILMIGGFYGSA